MTGLCHHAWLILICLKSTGFMCFLQIWFRLCLFSLFDSTGISVVVVSHSLPWSEAPRAASLLLVMLRWCMPPFSPVKVPTLGTTLFLQWILPQAFCFAGELVLPPYSFLGVFICKDFRKRKFDGLIVVLSVSRQKNWRGGQSLNLFLFDRISSTIMWGIKGCSDQAWWKWRVQIPQFPSVWYLSKAWCADALVSDRRVKVY